MGPMAGMSFPRTAAGLLRRADWAHPETTTHTGQRDATWTYIHASLHLRASRPKSEFEVLWHVSHIISK